MYMETTEITMAISITIANYYLLLTITNYYSNNGHYEITMVRNTDYMFSEIPDATVQENEKLLKF